MITIRTKDGKKISLDAIITYRHQPAQAAGLHLPGETRLATLSSECPQPEQWFITTATSEHPVGRATFNSIARHLGMT